MENHNGSPFDEQGNVIYSRLFNEQGNLLYSHLRIDDRWFPVRVRQNQPPLPPEVYLSSSEELYSSMSSGDEEEINQPPPQISNEAAASYRRAGLFPASSKAIQGLREVTAAGAREEECAICLQDFEAEEKLRMMPCSHTFHQRCIFDWLRLSCICPLCRRALPTQQEDDDKLGCPELGATG
uniref:RING-type domain-containing protein n=1 Tax=Oryza punctata TaxID=4537 RepID=A0A0E0MJK0_ORYPU